MKRPCCRKDVLVGRLVFGQLPFCLSSWALTEPNDGPSEMSFRTCWSSSEPVLTGTWNFETCVLRLPSFRNEQGHSPHSNFVSAGASSKLWTRRMCDRRLPSMRRSILCYVSLKAGAMVVERPTCAWVKTSVANANIFKCLLTLRIACHLQCLLVWPCTNVSKGRTC